MKPVRQSSHSSSHFLALLTGCVLMLACATEAQAATTSGFHYKNTLVRSLNGETKSTIRKIRHLINLFIDQDQANRNEQAQAGDPSLLLRRPPAFYRSVYGYRVKHLRHREIRTWLLRE